MQKLSTDLAAFQLRLKTQASEDAEKLRVMAENAQGKFCEATSNVIQQIAEREAMEVLTEKAEQVVTAALDARKAELEHPPLLNDMRGLKSRFERAQAHQEAIDNQVTALSEWSRTNWKEDLKSTLSQLLDDKLVSYQAMQRQYEEALNMKSQLAEQYNNSMANVHQTVLGLLAPQTQQTTESIKVLSGEVSSLQNLVQSMRDSVAGHGQTLSQITVERQAAKAATGSAQIPQNLADRLKTVEKTNETIIGQQGKLETSMKDVQTASQPSSLKDNE